MAEQKPNRESIQQALNHDWPEIQKRLIEEAGKKATEERDPYEPYWTTNPDGTRTLHGSFDSWWLKHFDRKDVIFELPGIVVMNTKDWNADSAAATLRAAYGLGHHEECADCFIYADILKHIERFPEGQFAAIRISGPAAGNTVGMAATLRTSRPPTAPILPWREAIGSLQLSAHEPDSDWLYGVEMAVHPMYQRKGVGTALYDARKRLVGLLNLRGWYMVGMLLGYHNHADEMDVVEYGNSVIAREIKDPTVTMQMNRGFRPERVITDYVDESAAGDAGILLVWENPCFDPGRAV